MKITMCFPVRLGLLIPLIGLLVACQPAIPLAESTAPGISVGITDDICPNVTVELGQQLTWTNQDKSEHIVRHKPADGVSLFSSGTLQPGDSFAFTFVEAGSFPYDCSEDGNFSGTVTVEP